MIKKAIIFAGILCLVGSLTAHARTFDSMQDANTGIIQKILYLENGDCLIEYMPEILSVQRSSTTGQKIFRYRNSDGVVEWTAVLSGSFTFNGSSATCTAASCITSVQQGNWHETYNYAYPSGNTAQADITMVRKVLFVTVQTETAHLVLSCDANGNLS